MKRHCRQFGNRTKSAATLIVLLALAPLLLGFTNPFGNKAAQGVRSLERGDYVQAVQKLTEAAEAQPDNPEIQYNLGSALYRQGKFKEAVEAYSRASYSQDSQVEQQALYNMGNAFFQQGDYKAAIERYQAALNLDPQDQDAKYNLELARKKLFDEQQKQQQQQQDQQNKQCPNPQQGQDKQQQDQQQQQQGQQGQQDQQDQQQQQNEQQQDQQGQQQQSDQQKQQPGQQGQQQPGQAQQATKEQAAQQAGQAQQEQFMTADQADQLLQSLGRQEVDIRRAMLRRWSAAQRQTTDKDW